jgi:putative ABC transport system ATP-binding protein
VPTSLFSFEGVTVRFGDALALREVSLDLPPDGVTVLAGHSGAGKSTLLRLCNTLEVPSAGRVSFRGQDLRALDPLAHRRTVGMVFQRPALFPGTVADNLRVAAPDADDARCATALERAGLPSSFLERVGDDLSGGEAQRACLARTLVTEPDVLLMDEPTSSLDPGAVADLERSARSLADDGVALIWVTHDLAQAERIADHTVVLKEGQVASADERRRFLEGRA